jgi:hypothetical protein
VEPAPEIVAEPPLDELVDALELELLDELELLLPQAARPSTSKATLKSAPILFLITTSPLAGLSLDCARGTQFYAESACRGKSVQPPVASM